MQISTSYYFVTVCQLEWRNKYQMIDDYDGWIMGQDFWTKIILISKWRDWWNKFCLSMGISNQDPNWYIKHITALTSHLSWRTNAYKALSQPWSDVRSKKRDCWLASMIFQYSGKQWRLGKWKVISLSCYINTISNSLQRLLLTTIFSMILMYYQISLFSPCMLPISGSHSCPCWSTYISYGWRKNEEWEAEAVIWLPGCLWSHRGHTDGWIHKYCDPSNQSVNIKSW
jgi:hypothetical protein